MKSRWQTNPSPNSVTERIVDESADLVRRLAAGEELALEKAFELYGERCNAIAYRILHNGELARDAVQDAFFALWRHREGLVVRTAGLAPWLYVVTRNAALGILRSETARLRREERVETQPDSRGSPDPADVVSARSNADVLEAALRKLPTEQQGVLELAYFKYLTMSQIAEQTQAPIGTVKRRVQLGLRHLGKILSETTS